jgi:hypothetical protein
VTVSFFRASPAPLGGLGFALGAECVLYIACSIGIARASEGAAASLAGLYVLRIGLTWYVSGRALPPVSLLALLFGYGLYRGIRGAAALDSMPASTPDAPLRESSR